MHNRWQLPQQLVRLISGRWTLAVLAELSDQGRRYQDIHEALDGISFKVLTETLRRAERDGLVSRHLDPERVETATLYEITDIGRTLDEPLTSLGLWVELNWPEVEAAQRHWDERSSRS
jgi:DNA-binding HxlR family transcriptional regulator